MYLRTPIRGNRTDFNSVSVKLKVGRYLSISSDAATCGIYNDDRDKLKKKKKKKKKYKKKTKKKKKKKKKKFENNKVRIVLEHISQ